MSEYVSRQFVGTQRDPSAEEAEQLEGIDRCAGCGYWIYDDDLDDEGFCADCQQERDEGRI